MILLSIRQVVASGQLQFLNQENLKEIFLMFCDNFLILITFLSRLALKIVVMTREQGTLNWEQGTGKRFSATLLFVTYVGFFPFTYLI